jgi:hypothetical protein
VVQRQIFAAIQAQPTRLWTIPELAEVAYPDAAVLEHKHLSSVRTALNKLPGLRQYKAGKVGSGVSGWRKLVRLAG